MIIQTITVFEDGIFRPDAVQLPHCPDWSYNLPEEDKRHAPVSEPSTSNIIQLSDMTVPRHAVVAELEEEEGSSEDETCTEMLLKESREEPGGWEGQKESRLKNNLSKNLWEPSDFEDKLEEALKKVRGTAREKSVSRRFLNRLDGLLQDLCKRKISKTYRRERQDGDKVYHSKNIDNVNTSVSPPPKGLCVRLLAKSHLTTVSK